MIAVIALSRLPSVAQWIARLECNGALRNLTIQDVKAGSSGIRVVGVNFFSSLEKIVSSSDVIISKLDEKSDFVWMKF
ncbi:hypothetical protein TNCV_1627631 [Trichonephila clavipes]|nr:hypothetical protein TNCV_1627631 [Trichonephila clavipes]